MKKIILILLVIHPFLIFAHDNSEFEFWGFSEDLKYCAFEIFGTEDLGYPYSIFYIIDVDKNEYACPPIELKGDDSVLNLRIKNLTVVKPIFESYQIIPDFKGTLVFYNIRIDEKVYEQNFTIFADQYTLNLIQKPYDIYNMLKLTITNDSVTTVLQEDDFLPDSRDQTDSYRLLCAYYCYGKIAVFIEYDEWGYEGFNRRQMLVTGVLKTHYLPMQYD